MKRKIIPYQPKLKALARQLRNNSTQSEIRLWNELKNKKLNGFRFHRQKPLLSYIVDFYCYDLALCIELDGYSHQLEKTISKDEVKTNALKQYGLTVMQFDDREVINDMANVLRTIEQFIARFEERHTPAPPALAGQAISRGEEKAGKKSSPLERGKEYSDRGVLKK